MKTYRLHITVLLAVAAMFAVMGAAPSSAPKVAVGPAAVVAVTPTAVHAPTAPSKPAMPEAAMPAAPVSVTAPHVPAAAAPPSTATAVHVEPAAPSSAPVTVDEIVSDAGKVVNDWKAVGFIAGLIALVNLLMNLLKFGPVDEFFTSKKITWVKPFISMGLGAVLGFLLSWQTGASLANSIVVGIMAGLGGTGVHQVVSKRKAEKRME